MRLSDLSANRNEDPVNGVQAGGVKQEDDPTHVVEEVEAEENNHCKIIAEAGAQLQNQKSADSSSLREQDRGKLGERRSA